MTIKINYVDTLPGMGKSYKAIQVMTERVKRKEGITFYVAPTIKLLKETKKLLLEKVDSKYINLVQSRSKFGSSERTVATIRQMLGGTHDSYGVQKAMLPEGSIVLMSHETFIKLPATFTSTGSSLPRRASTHVIFDEARKCSLRMTDIKLPLKLGELLWYEYFEMMPHKRSAELHRIIGCNVDEDETIHVALKNTKGLGQGTKDKLLDLINSIKNPAVEVYAMHAIESDMFKFHEMLLPHKIFQGWASVTLMSAFLKTSQLWHAIITDRYYVLDGQAYNKPETRRKNILQPAVELTNITDSWVFNYKSRLRDIKKRYETLTIVPLTNAKKLVSKRSLMSLLVSSDINEKKEKEKFHKLAMSKFQNDLMLRTVKGKTQTRAPKYPTLGNVLNVYEEGTRNRLSTYDLDLQKWLLKLPGVVLHSPIEWYSRAAYHVFLKWRTQTKMPDYELLITYNPNGPYADCGREALDDVGADYQVMPFVAHGLNEFIKHPSVAYLASYKMAPTLNTFLNILLPDYGVDTDYMIDSCIQSITRCNVRDIESHMPTLIIVTDREMAHAVKEALLCVPHIISAQRFGIPDKIPFLVNRPVDANKLKEYQKKSRGKTRVKQYQKEYQKNYRGLQASSPAWKDLQKQRVYRSRCKRNISQGKATAEDLNIIEKIIKKLEARHKEFLSTHT